jgi:hypothetical protein
MKTLLLFTTSLLLNITTVSATELTHEPNNTILEHSKRYRFVEPVVFIENNIEFVIFPNGDFDFESKNESYYNPYNSRRTDVNTSYKTRGVNIQYTTERFYKPMIVKDRFGNITRIGNTLIYYDRMGDVTQIGSVDIDYQRGNKIVSKVGGLKVAYNHWGQIVHTSGYVNRLNRDMYYQISINKNSLYDNNYDEDYFYYKKNGEIKKLKKNKH